MSTDSNEDISDVLREKCVAFVGRLASMAKRDAAQLVRRHGAVVSRQPGPSVDLVVVGEAGLPLLEIAELDAVLDGAASDGAARDEATQAAPEIITETQLWQRLGMVDVQQEIHRLYTPAMLADLLGVPVAVIRRWHRRGLIVPAREVRRLPYFDFQEVATARRLAELLAAGVSPAAIEKKLARLARYLPGVERPMAQLSVIVEGKQILLRQGDGLIEPGGQLRFDFEAAGFSPTLAEVPDESDTLPSDAVLQLAEGGRLVDLANSPSEMVSLAAELEESGHLETAAEMYRAAMAAAGPSSEVCFQVAELLYRLGDLAGARERYYMAIELDEDYVEARANLGCVLAETGEHDLAVAALQGALAYHGDYADVHYHLARVLDEADRRDEAHAHWEAFLELAPDSPWADEARNRLGEN
jgi:tetratricopeptide (TPR) repeat protein